MSDYVRIRRSTRTRTHELKFARIKLGTGKGTGQNFLPEGYPGHSLDIGCTGV